MVFKTSKLQTQIFLENNNSILEIKNSNNFFYPSLAYNSVSFLTYLSIEYSNTQSYDKAIDILYESLENNENCLYTKYLLSRNYIYIKDVKNAEILLDSLFSINPKIETISSLYFSLLGETKNEEKLISLRPSIEGINNQLIWDYYFSALVRSKETIIK